MLSLFRGGAVVLFMVAAAWPQQPADKKSAKQPDLCPNAQTTVEINACVGDLAQKADATLNALYQKIQKAIRAKIAEEKSGPLEGYQQRALAKLKAAELAWIHYRDAQCDAEEQQFEGGTISTSVLLGCKKDLAEQRADDLQKTYAIYLK